MSAQPATARPDKTLRLHEALQLLAQAGHAPPDDAQRGSLPWLQAVIDGLCDLSCRDALTGLANRRQLELAIGREVDRVARAGEPALVLIGQAKLERLFNGHFAHATVGLARKGNPCAGRGSNPQP